MHSLSVPADKNIVLSDGCDVVAEVFSWAHARIKALENAGIKRERIIFDIGIGFGKTAAQSHELIKNIAKFKELGVALFVGHSRKSFLGANSVAEADQKTLEISRFLSAQGVDYLRVHNVQIHI
jgi:dihydropteroate synthase